MVQDLVQLSRFLACRDANRIDLRKDVVELGYGRREGASGIDAFPDLLNGGVEFAIPWADFRPIEKLEL